MEAQVHYAACFYRCFFGHCPPNRTIDPALTFVREPCRRTMALLAIFRVGWTEHHNKPPCTLDLDALDSVSTRKCCRVNMNTVAATWISVCIVDYYVAIADHSKLLFTHSTGGVVTSTQSPFGYMCELGKERLHCVTGFGDRYRFQK